MEIKTTYTVTSSKGEYYDKTFDKMEEAEAFYINEQKINQAASKLEPLVKRRNMSEMGLQFSNADDLARWLQNKSDLLIEVIKGLK